MKIVHINTFPQGGAATAALRLHHEFLAQHIHSYFVSIRIQEVQIRNSVMIPFAHPTFLQRTSNVLGKPLAAGHIRERLLKKYRPECEYLGIPQSDYSVEALDVVQQADIINLHWTSRLLDYKNFFRSVKKPIVWTLHDLSPFMGCFNYPVDQANNPAMKKIDQEFFKEKAGIYKEFKFPVHFIAPSKWILEEAKRRLQLPNFYFHHIPYGIDSAQFRYIPRAVARQKLALPENKTIVLFVAEKVETKRKRFDLIYQLADDLAGRSMHFISIGGGAAANAPSNIFFTGRIDSAEKMNLYYAAADYFLMPSSEDNFPNVVLESLFCGTPVISNNAGGMRDIVERSNGFLIDDFELEKVKAILLSHPDSSELFDRERISSETRKQYDTKNMADRYLKVYNEILAG